MCQGHQILLYMKLIILLLSSALIPLNAASLEKFDETPEAQPMLDTSIKCGECPCVNPCTQQQPPPPPPKITQYCPPQLIPQNIPPPPRFYYFTGPQVQYQQTPPPPRFSYVIGGPQGKLYPTEPFTLEIYNGATFSCNVQLVGLLLPMICGMLEILVYLGL